jgi:hypothetical protein
MSIAVLAWGALLAQPGLLALQEAWQPDGPRLPLEFARIAGDGRLTLVIQPTSDTPLVAVAWARAAWMPLAAVVENLRDTERTVPGHIGALPTHPAQRTILPAPLIEEIARWRQAQRLEAVVWSQLPPNFVERTGLPLTPEHALVYLQQLPKGSRQAALTYIRQSVLAVSSPIGQAILAHFGVAEPDPPPARRS